MTRKGQRDEGRKRVLRFAQKKLIDSSGVCSTSIRNRVSKIVNEFNLFDH
jgi:hypothetical protein